MLDPSLIRACVGGVKICNKCNVEKPETEFKAYKKRGAYTRWYVCMACELEDGRSQKRLDQHAIARKERRLAGYIKRERHNAGMKLRYAVRTGKIVRPTTCERCGQEPPPLQNGKPRIEAHHHDYSKPLDVRWLCKPCHAIEHKEALANAAPVKQPAPMPSDIAERLREYSHTRYQQAILGKGSHDTILRELLSDAVEGAMEIERLRGMVTGERKDG